MKNRSTLKYIVLTFAILSFHINQASATNDICMAVNSINIYQKENILKIQNYFKQGYFPKISLTGLNDNQTKYYVKKFQFAFGLRETGTLTNETLKFLKDTNKCFDLDDKVYQMEGAKIVRKNDGSDIIQNLISSILSKYIYFYSQNSNPVTVTNASDTNTNDNSTTTVTTNNYLEGEITSCIGRQGKIYNNNQTVNDICDTVQTDTDYNVCLRSRRAANIPMVCTNSLWVKVSNNQTENISNCTFENTPVGSFCGGQCHYKVGAAGNSVWGPACEGVL